MKWHLQNVRGSRETVKTQVNGNAGTPQKVKDLITAEIDSMPSNVLACIVDGFCSEIEGSDKTKITRNIQIAVVGVIV